ncbi:hypothetical protein, partial [Gimesia panareensis]|uniref:hypothetical protein n=1 Tax=Gimesia panareensis TaxID=2527978 RepID=UPI001E2EC8E4
TVGLPTVKRKLEQQIRSKEQVSSILKPAPLTDCIKKEPAESNPAGSFSFEDQIVSAYLYFTTVL